MNLAALIIDSVLLLGIVCASVYGAVILPAGAQLPMHLGPGGYTNWMPKNVALLAWPALGVALFVILAATGRSHQAHGGQGHPLPVILTAALALMLVNHVGALRAAVSRGGRN
jgi:hypothetical protein